MVFCNPTMNCIMTKSKLLTIAVVLLLAVNLLQLWFVATHNGRKRVPEGPKDIIIEKLGFDKEQQQRYLEMIRWHRTQIREREKQILSVKKALYATLNDSAASGSKDSLLHELGQLQTQIERVHYQHFEDIRSVCKPGQMERYEAFTREIDQLFGPPERRQRP